MASAIMIVSFSLLEIILRWQGVTPGFICNRYWNKVDSLIVYDDFTTDSNGIITLAPTVNEQLAHYRNMDFERLTVESMDLTIKYILLSHFWGQGIASTSSFSVDKDIAQRIGSRYEKLLRIFRHPPSSEFYDMVKSLESDKQKDSVDLAYINFIQHPINADGFYSIPFRNFSTKKKKVLVVGDSFTFGFSAVPLFNSFAYLLAAKGYAVFNGGIGGADPAQYAAVVKKYIGRIKPDVVIVCFYEGAANDVMMHDRELKPNCFLWYPTNAFWIKGYFNGKYFDNAQEAYNYFKIKSFIPNTDKNIINLLASKTAIGTRLWLGMHRLLWKDQYCSFDETIEYYRDSLSYSEKYLSEIDSVCRVDKVRCEFLIFPGEDDLALEMMKHPPYVFRSIDYKTVFGLSKSDYYDNHFNNEGHRKVAEYIHELLQTE